MAKHAAPGFQPGPAQRFPDFATCLAPARGWHPDPPAPYSLLAGQAGRSLTLAENPGLCPPQAGHAGLSPTTVGQLKDIRRYKP